MKRRAGQDSAGSGRRGWRRILGGDPESDAAAELEFHAEMRLRDYVSRGMTEAEARAAVRARMGDIAAFRAECVAVDRAQQRGRRRRTWLAEVGQDVRFGTRMLLRAPSFALMAVLTLAIGIGATTAIFSLANGVLLAPLPYKDPHRLVRLWETSPQGETRNVVSPGNVVEWQARARSFTALDAYYPPYGMTLTEAGEAARVKVAVVQPSLMTTLGAQPALGRILLPADDHADDVVVVSESLWRERLGGAADALGRRLVLNDVPVTVVGVMPRAFAFPASDVDVWMPLTRDMLDPTERRSHNLVVLGRLAPELGVADAQAEMTAIATQIAAEHPQHMTGWGVNVRPLHADLTASTRPLLVLLLVGVAVVLLAACANLMNLLLARAVAREREIAVRGALGAGQGRLARQLLTESALLALLGGAGALLVAPVLLRALLSAAPPDLPLLERVVIDGRVLLFTGAVTLICAAVFGALPALRLSRTGMQATLRAARAGGRRDAMRLRAGLIVAQVAVSVVLLIGTGLFIRSSAALQAVDTGFDIRGLAVMSVGLPPRRYAESSDHVTFYTQLLERAAGMPGIAGVAGTSAAPGGVNTTFSFSIQGRVATNPSGREDPEPLRAVTPGYFELMRQRLVRGRRFTHADRADAPPVVIINEALARKHWPAGDALGARIAFRAGESPWLEIVGIAADVRLEGPDVEPVPAMYIPYAQKTWAWLGWMTVLARTEPDASTAAAQQALRAALAGVDPRVPPQRLTTVQEVFGEAIARRTFAMVLVSGFGVIALLLVVIGLYGLLAYTVTQQRHEIGVRLALGASAHGVMRDLLLRSLRLAVPGALIGALLALGVARLIRSLLFGVGSVDLPAYAAATLLVIGAALLTALAPARRAARTSPLEALRAD
jgi:putative ABC transport system permease protein